MVIKIYSSSFNPSNKAIKYIILLFYNKNECRNIVVCYSPLKCAEFCSNTLTVFLF